MCFNQKGCSRRRAKKFRKSSKWTCSRGSEKGGRSRTGLGGAPAAADVVLLLGHAVEAAAQGPLKSIYLELYCSFLQGKPLENPVGFLNIGKSSSSDWSCTIYLPSHQGTAGPWGPWELPAGSVRAGSGSWGSSHTTAGSIGHLPGLGTGQGVDLQMEAGNLGAGDWPCCGVGAGG